MKPFSFFITNKSVKRQASDAHISDALVKEALERISMAKEALKIADELIQKLIKKKQTLT